MKQQGNISLSRVRNGTYLMKVTNSVGDDVIEVEMSAEQFASSITSQQAKCDLVVFSTGE
jgi:hypothetical protein